MLKGNESARINISVLITQYPSKIADTQHANFSDIHSLHYSLHCILGETDQGYGHWRMLQQKLFEVWIRSFVWLQTWHDYKIVGRRLVGTMLQFLLQCPTESSVRLEHDTEFLFRNISFSYELVNEWGLLSHSLSGLQNERRRNSGYFVVVIRSHLIGRVTGRPKDR
jgi:hypothetical protein